MEFYNLQSKDRFEEFYRVKVNELLLNPIVLEYLDNSKVNLLGNNELNLFPNYDRKKFRNLTTSVKRCSMDNMYNTNLVIQKKFKDITLRKLIERKMTELDNKIDIAKEVVSKDIDNQINNFEEKKRKKMLKQSTHSHHSASVASIEIESKQTMTSSLMLNEIEQYVEKHMNEMNKAVDELKYSYKQEVSNARENGFDEIAEGLTEDLEVEVENLKILYEEQRLKQLEGMRAKYQQKELYPCFFSPIKAMLLE